MVEDWEIRLRTDKAALRRLLKAVLYPETVQEDDTDQDDRTGSEDQCQDNTQAVEGLRKSGLVH